MEQLSRREDKAKNTHAYARTYIYMKFSWTERRTAFHNQQPFYCTICCLIHYHSHTSHSGHLPRRDRFFFSIRVILSFMCVSEVIAKVHCKHIVWLKNKKHIYIYISTVYIELSVSLSLTLFVAVFIRRPLTSLLVKLRIYIKIHRHTHNVRGRAELHSSLL